MKRILVTGAGGFIGRNLIPELLERNYKVIAFDIMSLSLENVICFRGDITKKADILKASKGGDAVIHLAGILGSPDYQKNYQIHVEGTKNLIAACKKNNITRIIAYSSVAAAKEKTGSYGATKKELEQLFLKSKDINTTILRPTMVLGYKGKGIDTIVKQIQSYPFIPLLGSGKAIRQPIWVKDITKLTIDLLENKKSYGNTYDVGGEEISFKNFIIEVKNNLNVKKSIIPIPIIVAKVLAKLMEKVSEKPLFTYENVHNLALDEKVDTNFLKQELNFQSTPLSEALPQILKEYKK